MAKKKPEYTEKDLIAAIKDMNKVLDCDPALDLDDDMEMDDLITSFKEGAEMAAAGDKFAKGTVALAGKLKVSLGEENGEKEAEKEEEEEKIGKSYSSKKDTKKGKKAPAKKDTKKADKKDTPKKEDKKPRYTRNMAVAEVIKKLPKKGNTLQEIMDKSDDLFVKKGGKSNPSATNINSYMLSALVLFDVIKCENKKYTLVD